jgi:hypothetical protein
VAHLEQSFSPTKAFVSDDDDRFFWVESSKPLGDLWIAKTQRDYRITASLGGRLVRTPPNTFSEQLGALCISVVGENRIIPTIFTYFPTQQDVQWYLTLFKPSGYTGRLVDVAPLLEEMFP